MHYTAETILTIEYLTSPLFLKNQVVARQKWRLVQATPMEYKEIRFIHRGDPTPQSHRKSRQNIILVDWRVTIQEFMLKVRDHFSKQYKVEREDLHFVFDHPFPFMTSDNKQLGVAYA